ncbi:MAG: cyanophycinase [Deltaproteobacteria bacterium]|nr:cyanophycinase [Deltaproteobacteria bacterium]
MATPLHAVTNLPRNLPCLAALLFGACVPTAPDPPPSGGADPDAPWLGNDPCPEATAGIELEESAPFTAGGTPAPLVVLMGGGVEVDEAAVAFAEAAGGGDLLVLRATGSTSSYTEWFAEELSLSPRPAAVGTVLLNDPDAGDDGAVLCRVARADALWLAGGDQSDYLLRWPNTLHEALARAVTRGVAVGGTSAGAMSLSSLAFDAAQGSIDSDLAMAAPLDDAVSLSDSPFAAPALQGTLVDTHFSERARLGRLVTFLARAGHQGTPVTGLGIDEETAVVIDGDTVSVSGAGEAWLVSLQGEVALAEGAPLDAVASVAPLSAQGRWPATSGADAPGAVPFTVVDGQAQ